MVLTAGQITSFFEDADQMGLKNRTRIDSLVPEGITTVDELKEWDDDDWDQWASNFKRPDKTADPLNPALLIATVPYSLSVKSLKRLKTASKLVKYYDSVSIPVTAANIKWLVMDNFIIQRKAMEIKAKETKPDVPKLTKTMTVAKWDDSLRVYASQAYGARKSTLEYLLRKEAAVNPVHPPLVANCPHSADAESIQGEQAMRLSHNHPLFRNDNKTLFGVLEVALRGTTYDASIKPFQRSSDGRKAYLALIAQHAGKDKWVKILRDAKTYVNERKWDGTTSQLLQSHVEKCRECYVDIENAAEHIKEQIPEPRTRVQSLLDSIEGCKDPNVCARVAAISNETNGMLDDFEAAVAHLIPVCPVAAKVGKKRKNAQVSGLGGNLKAGTGPKTGVELRYYKPKEFSQLSPEMMTELRELRPPQKGKGKGTPKGNGAHSKGKSKGKYNDYRKKGALKGQVAAAIKKHMEDDAKAKEEEQVAISEIAKIISSAQSSTNQDATAASAAVKLNAILKRKRDTP
jgi:hypothetical protein